jgi:hypothetical protein
MNLKMFAFKSLSDWLLWPWRVTFHADRFVEGLPGFLGVSVPFLAILFFFHKAEDRSRSWWILLLTASAGTLALWRYTAYLRYWMPGLWLAYLALQPGLARWNRSGVFRGLCAAAAGAVVFLQLPLTMATLWKDPQGWPWDYHRRLISEDDYLERAYPGLGGLRRGLQDVGWDDIVLMTGFQGPGHLPPCLPVEMHLWELRLHAQDPEGQTAYLRNMAPSYWIMNRESKDAEYFAENGVGPRFMTADRLVGRSGPYDIYRLKRSPS